MSEKPLIPLERGALSIYLYTRLLGRVSQWPLPTVI